MTDLTATLATREERHHPSVARAPIAEVEGVLRERLDLIERGEPIPGVDAPLGDGDDGDDQDAAPPPRLVATGWTPARQRAFIDHLATSGCVTHAARAVDLSKQSAYQLRDRSPNSIFALAWSVAIARSRRLILDQATEVALAGREVPLVYRGQEIGTRTIHSERLMMFLLGMKREPLHPALTEHELAELWPAMLEEIDAVLPSTLTPERMAALGIGEA